MSENPQNLIPCFLCGNGLRVKNSKRNKPYFICEPCGVQVFVRRESGILKLKALLLSISKSAVNYPGAQARTTDLIAQTNRLAELKAKLKEIQNKQGLWEFLTGDGSLALAEKAIKQEIETIEDQLKHRIKKRI